MASARTERHAIGLIPLGLASLLSAGLLYLGTGLTPLPWLALVAPWPLLWAAYRAPTWQGLGAAVLVFLLAGLNLVPYLRETLSLPWPVIALALFNPAWHFALAFWISRRLHRYGRSMLATLALPAIWASLNYLEASVSPHGSFGNLAYSQIDNLLLTQLLSLTGLWGLDFLLLLVPNALALGLQPQSPIGLRPKLAVLAALPLLLAMGYGYVRLQYPATTGTSLRLATLAYDTPAFPLPRTTPESAQLLAQIEQDLSKAAKAGAQFVLLPETIVRLSHPEPIELAEHWQAIADRLQISLIIGIAEPNDAGDGERNAAWLIQPAKARQVYAKRHLLPMFEDRYQPGQAPLVFSQGETRFGIAICKDMDFPALGHEYGRKQNQLLFVPAWDFDRDGPLHAQMATFRGIENGFAVLRSARRGMMSLTDAQGHKIGWATSRERFMIADLPLPAVQTTAYTRFGDWFAWLSLGLSLVTLIAASARPKRSVPSPIGLSPP